MVMETILICSVFRFYFFFPFAAPRLPALVRASARLSRSLVKARVISKLKSDLLCWRRRINVVIFLNVFLIDCVMDFRLGGGGGFFFKWNFFPLEVGNRVEVEIECEPNNQIFSLTRYLFFPLFDELCLEIV